MDDRIGKQGEGGYRPKCTIQGRVMRKATARSDAEQILIRRNLGNGYYVVVDTGVIPNLEELIAELKEGLPNEPKRKKHLAASPVSETGDSL